jgi:hypothetical protein
MELGTVSDLHLALLISVFAENTGTAVQRAPVAVIPKET